MAESEDLNPEQTEKLLQFQDLTGIEEMSRCREMLQRHNWDMEVAVQSRFNEEEGAPAVYREERREARTPPVDAHPADQSIYTVARPRPHGLVGWGYFIVLFPFRFVYSTVLDILKFAYRLLRPDPRRHVTDPVGDVVAFVHKFEEEYGLIHPTFFNGTYSQALNEAKRELRFLQVYLHGDDHQDSANFCRSTLCCPEVAEFVDANMLFWACNTNSPEGFRVSQALRENTYPFLATIVLRENRMTVVARIEGPIGGEELTTRLGRVMADNEAFLITVRAERDERSFNQTLRNQQDEAYQESLKADQEKERKRKEEKEKLEREEQEEKDKEQREHERIEEITQRKEKIRDAMTAEPLGDDPDTIRIVLKLPNGTRLERRFFRNQSLLHLYNYVFVHEAAPDDFQIITNFPRKVLPCQPTEETPEPLTFDEVGLGKSEMLFVHDNDA